jgi:hypothetical protein
MFLNMYRYLRFSSPVFWEPTHQLNELLGGGSRLWFRQRSSQFRDDFVAHCDLNPRRCVLSHPANQFGQPFSCFADGEFHCNEVYKGVQAASNGLTRVNVATCPPPGRPERLNGLNGWNDWNRAQPLDDWNVCMKDLKRERQTISF